MIAASVHVRYLLPVSKHYGNLVPERYLHLEIVIGVIHMYVDEPEISNAGNRARIWRLGINKITSKTPKQRIEKYFPPETPISLHSHRLLIFFHFIIFYSSSLISNDVMSVYTLNRISPSCRYSFTTCLFATRRWFVSPCHARPISNQLSLSLLQYQQTHPSHYSTMVSKRAIKQISDSDDDIHKASSKKTKLGDTSSDSLHKPHHFSAESEKYGIVLRKYYPPEMSNERAQAYNDNLITRPIEELESALEETASTHQDVQVKKAVVHWFKMDLRTTDNRALWEASQKAQEAGVPLICLYILSPEDFEAHIVSPRRVDYILRALQTLKQDLAALDIPLYMETVEKRKDIPQRILDLMEEWKASHLYANMEYEVDELRREAKMVQMCRGKGFSMKLYHDTCVVPPGLLHTGEGKQYAVYTPWFRKWIAHLHENPGLLDLFDAPAKNSSNARQNFGALFDCKLLDAPENKRLSTEDTKLFHATWPAGEHAAMDRLEKFCEEKIGEYGSRRNFPSEASTSSISLHLASGTLSARTAVRTARDRNKTKKLDAGVDGIRAWISEVAWRDFYKHVLVHWPYIWQVIVLSHILQ